MRNSILTSDLHLTTNPRDEYRWELFPWLAEQCRKKKARWLYILGDLCDAKDNHPSSLVNSVVQALLGLVEAADLDRLVILRGNHDGVDPDWPYFRFLGEFPKVKFIATPQRMWNSEPSADVFLLPHSRSPSKEWDDVVRAQWSRCSCVLAHVTVQGAEAENEKRLDGVSVSVFAKARKVWSGDVHVPQVRGKVEYVGAPYPIRFGDSFKPRVVWLDDRGKAHDLYFPTIARRLLDLEPPIKALPSLRRGDQVKVRVHLSRSEYGRWRELKEGIREGASSAGIDLVAVELVPKQEDARSSAKPSKLMRVQPNRLFAEFCKHAKVDIETSKVGKALMEKEGQP